MKYLLVGLLTLGGVACSVQPERIAWHDFGPPPPVKGVQSNTAFLVRVDAPEWLQDSRIRYRLLYASLTQVRFYTLDRWIAMPSELFEQQLLAGLKQNAEQKDAPLIIRLLDFEQQFDAPGSARAVLRFSVEVYAPDNTTLVRTQTMRLEQPTRSPDAKGAVNALAYLTRRSVDKIQVFLSGLPTRAVKADKCSKSI